jgi:thiamine pyridinylase
VDPVRTRKGEGPQAEPPPASDGATLNVALYKYVPSLPAWTSAVSIVWQQFGTGIGLNFVDYDPYSGPPPPTLDVFAFDCIFTDDLLAGGYVDPIAADEVDDAGDLFPFAVQASSAGESSFAGIPYLGCTNVLFYRASDPILGRPGLGIADLLGVLGEAQYPGPVPPQNQGLMIDLGGKTTDACLYSILWREARQAFWPQPFPTGLPPQFDNDVFAGLRSYAAMAGRAQALYDDPGHDRVNWFASGYGRALVGLTETMSGWSSSALGQIALRPLPTVRTGDAPRILCYADAIGIRPGLGGRRAAAVLLANVIASQTVALAAMAPVGDSAQYLMPARQSVLAQLASQLPKYQAIQQMLASAPLSPVRMASPATRAWLRPAGQEIMVALFPVTAEALPEPVPPAPQRPASYHSTPAGLWRREGSAR